MPNISVSKNYIDGVAVADLHPGLEDKRDDTFGILQGRLQIDNEVHTNSKQFIVDKTDDYATAEPPLRNVFIENGGTSTSISSSAMLNANVEVNDLIVWGGLSYSGGYTPALPSGFTNITNGAYSSYHGFRWAWKNPSASDILGGITVNTGNASNILGVFKIAGSGTITKGSHVATQFSSDIAGPLTPSTTYSGGLIIIALDLGAADRTLATFTDDAGSLKVLSDLDGLWAEGGGAVDTSMIAYRSINAGQTVSAQSADVNRASFNATLIVQFWKQ
tara:strand:- start:331 stop:1158 length:828 start_codon:yes stop_codon:yes gene_type:complete